VDALERHGYYRSDDLHADRAIGLVGDLACIYEGHPGSSRRRLPQHRAAARLPRTRQPRRRHPPPATTPAPCSPRWMSPPTTSATASRCAPTAPTSPAPTARPTSTTSRPSTRWPTACSGPAQAVPANRPEPDRHSSPQPTGRPASDALSAETARIPQPPGRHALHPWPAGGRAGHAGNRRTLRTLPFPDQWPHRPTYVIVVDQLRDWRPDLPPSLAELLEAEPARTREPEPDLEAEP